jgi:hypothetical protein
MCPQGGERTQISRVWDIAGSYRRIRHLTQSLPLNTALGTFTDIAGARSPAFGQRLHMPSFDEGAYTVRACAGRPLGAAPDNLYPAPSKLIPAQIDTLIAYLRARVIGRGRITRDECLYYYYDALSSSCDDLK